MTHRERWKSFPNLEETNDNQNGFINYRHFLTAARNSWQREPNAIKISFSTSSMTHQSGKVVIKTPKFQWLKTTRFDLLLLLYTLCPLWVGWLFSI